MQWKNGRQLSQVKTSKDTITYKYNIKGLRTRKYNSDYTYYYYYDDNNNLIAMMQGGVVAYFYYDSNNSVTAMSINDSMYYYVKNLQGDITKIVNHQGKVMVEYTYDAWGNILKEKSNVNPSYATVKEFNPFRYRGYVYDTDTGLYYLQSRYYDPKTGRFINADDTAYVDTNSGTPLSTNMFAYCENNHINDTDPDGYLRISSSRYKRRSWIIKVVAKYLPNITKQIRGKTIFKKSILGIRLKISVAGGTQTNANKALGMALSNKGMEVSHSISMGKRYYFSGGVGFNWSGLYLSYALGYNISSRIWCAIGLTLSISYFTAIAIAVCCAAMPYVSTFISSTIAVASSSIGALGAVMVRMTPRFIHCFI